jgi:hypothetical protein
MFRIALVASVVFATSACRLSLEGETRPGDGGADATLSKACMDATTYQNLAMIESEIFRASCIFSGCHNGAATDAGRLDLREGKAFGQIVNVASLIDPTRKYIVPNQPNQSWLLLMMGHFMPSEMSPPATGVPTPPGLMPQNSGGALVCKEKRDAIVRWIMMGATNN